MEPGCIGSAVTDARTPERSKAPGRERPGTRASAHGQGRTRRGGPSLAQPQAPQARTTSVERADGAEAVSPEGSTASERGGEPASAGWSWRKRAGEIVRLASAGCSTPGLHLGAGRCGEPRRMSPEGAAACWADASRTSVRDGEPTRCWRGGATGEPFRRDGRTLRCLDGSPARGSFPAGVRA
jgi:hypothetical protein